MKKLILVLIVVFAVLLAACDSIDDIMPSVTPINNNSNDIVSFEAVIIELSDDSAIVEPYENESIRGSADKIIISLKDNDEQFIVGDNIIVYYDGSVMESYPAQVNVLGIKKID